MVAALTEDHKCLTVALVKATESEQNFEVNLTGVRMAGPSTRWQFGRSGLDAENRIGRPQLAEVGEISMGDAPGTVSVAPATVNICRLMGAPAQRRSVSNPTCCWHKTIT